MLRIADALGQGADVGYIDIDVSEFDLTVNSVEGESESGSFIIQAGNSKNR